MIPEWHKGNYSAPLRVGKGAYGVVDTMTRLRDGKRIARKKYEDEGDGLRHDMLREVSVLRRCWHPHILCLIGVRKMHGDACLLLEGMRCHLKEHYQKTEPRPLEALTAHTRHIASALSCLNRHGVYHRDVKPHNILVDESGCAKLADFGQACLYLPGRCQTMNTCTRWYRSPETLTEDSYGLNVDIWGLGCTMVEMAVGKPLFACDDDASLVGAHRSFSHAVRAAIAAASRAVPVLADMLTVNPAQRPDADECLRRMGGGVACGADPAACPPSTRRGSCGRLPAVEHQAAPQTRAKLVGWMLKHGKTLSYDFSTMHVAIELLDRVVRAEGIARRRLRLTGAALLSVAGKITSSRDGLLPSVKDFSIITNAAHGAADIRSAEMEICALLDFDLLPCKAERAAFVSRTADFANTIMFFSERRSEVEKLADALAADASDELCSPLRARWETLLASHRLDGGVIAWHGRRLQTALSF